MKRPAIELHFQIPGDPVAKQRARTVQNVGRNALGALVTRTRTFTPDETRGYETRVKERAYLAMRDAQLEVLTGPCALSLSLHFSLRASSRDRYGELMEADPDSSNVLKAIEDGMNRIVYADDRQIAVHRIEKRWVERDHGPRAEVTVSSLANEWRVS